MIDLDQTAGTVADLADHMDRLQARVVDLQESLDPAARGFFRPTEDESVFALWVSYHKTRNALLEVIDTIREEFGKPAEHVISEFTVAYAAALVLVDAARFLRDHFARDEIVRGKLNESHLSYGIQEGSFDEIQMSLTDPHNALRLQESTQFYDEYQEQIRAEASANANLARLIEVIARRIDSVRVNAGRYIKARLTERRYQFNDAVMQGGLMRALYAFQQWGSRAVSSLTTMPGHVPCLPTQIASQMRTLLKPGDVFVTRKEGAVTNYFLPGYWPHAALYVGDERVIESLKDGVRERALESPFGNDAVALIRPRLDSETINRGLERARTHVGKPYDFDFDFTRSDRLVCTEVVYRSYCGLGRHEFPLTRRAGRQTLSAEDLLMIAIQGEFFEPVAVFCRDCSDDMLHGAEAIDALRRTIGSIEVESE